MKDRNKNRLGYKESMSGWIPDNWNALHLRDIAAINPQSLGSKTAANYEFYYIDLGSVKSGKIDIPKTRIMFSDAPSRARIVIQQGDVLLSTVRPNLKGFGHVSFEAPEHICSTGFAVIRCNSDYDDRFIYQSLYSEQSSRYFYGCVVGSGYPALNASDIDLMKIPCPDLLEQEKIADVLSCWDEGIQTLEELINEKRLCKKGFMQQLLTGKKRLPGFSHKWKPVTLRKVLRRTEPYEKLIEGTSYPLISVRRRAGGTFARGTVPRDDISYDQMAQVKLNDFLISKRQVSHGAYARVTETHAGCYVSSEYVILETKKNDHLYAPFLEWLSKQPIMWHKGYVSSNGVHIEKLILDPKHFLKHTILLPSVDEQKAIVEVLQTADEEIRILEEQLKTLYEQKKGLMQKLLTGEIRHPDFLVSGTQTEDHHENRSWGSRSKTRGKWNARMSKMHRPRP